MDLSKELYKISGSGKTFYEIFGKCIIIRP